jgi:hypothetical protein
VLQVGNNGKSDALQPKIGLLLHRPDEHKQKWLTAFYCHHTARNLWIREVLVGTDTDFASISEQELAYALVTNGLSHEDTLMKSTGSPFIIAFAFEESRQFYFASDNITPQPLGQSVKLDLTGNATNMPSMVLSHDYNFILTPEAWDHMALVTTKEEF